MNEQAVAEALEEIQVLVSSDGARLERLQSPKQSTVLLRLDLSGVGCEDCVLPPAMLSSSVQNALRSRAGDPGLVVEIDDPRDPA